MIFGFPGEGAKERRESIRLIMNICRSYPGAEFWTNIFTPYPGSPIMKRAFELGIDVPKTLEGWADFFPRYTVLPWLKGRDHERVQKMREYLRVAFNRVPIGNKTKHPLNAAVSRIDQPSRALAPRSRCYALPVELWMKNAASRLFPPRQSPRWMRTQLSCRGGDVLTFCSPTPTTSIQRPQAGATRCSPIRRCRR